MNHHVEEITKCDNAEVITTPVKLTVVADRLTDAEAVVGGVVIIDVDDVHVVDEVRAVIVDVRLSLELLLRLLEISKFIRDKK